VLPPELELEEEEEEPEPELELELETPSPLLPLSLSLPLLQAARVRHEIAASKLSDGVELRMRSVPIQRGDAPERLL
jgi:hypothetical protein